MTQLDAQGNPIVPTDDKGGTPPPQVTPPADDGKGKDDDKGGKDTVPSYRLKEEADKRRIAEEELAKYKKKEADDLEAKKKADEEAQLKKGEYDAVIKAKDDELASYKTKEAERDKKTAIIQGMVDKKLDEFKEKYGEDSLKEAKTIIGSDDPWVILDKIDAVEKVLGKKELPKGGSDLPGGGGDNKNLSYFQNKLEKGEQLSPSEMTEYYKLLGL